MAASVLHSQEKRRVGITQAPRSGESGHLLCIISSTYTWVANHLVEHLAQVDNNGENNKAFQNFPSGFANFTFRTPGHNSVKILGSVSTLIWGFLYCSIIYFLISNSFELIIFDLCFFLHEKKIILNGPVPNMNLLWDAHKTMEGLDVNTGLKVMLKIVY